MIETSGRDASRCLVAPRQAGAALVLQPAFVLSCERSGSTLLRWLLDSHSEVASPGELRLGRLAYDLYVTLSRTVSACEDDRRAEVRETLREVRAVLDGILGRYARARGKRVWCEKSPENLRYLEALANAYPDGRYVCLYRGCLDVVHSCLEASRDGFMDELSDYARRYPNNSVEAMVESWADKTSALLRFEFRNPELCRRVRYEDLVRTPESELRPIFELFGCSWEPEVLTRAFAERHDHGGGDMRIRQTASIETSRIGRGRHVPVERISAGLRRRVDSLSRKLGYPELESNGP